ncbi:MAG: hypothetical protein JXR34_04525 [Bacteroidales bacterium]|nr:hypothetical protein [Bacteroidales bacterium]
MEEIKVLLASLHSRAKRVAERNLYLEGENKNLQKRLKEAENEIHKRNSEINELKHQIEIIKIAGSITSETSDKGSKQKIAELVREIDYCITLLK